MYAKNIKIASLIVTYNRVDEVKAQMDIIRELWQPMFEMVDIYHEFNGKISWYPKKYREDFLHRHKEMSHVAGVSHMLNQGVKHILETDKKYDFIVVTSADTWIYDPKKLKQIVLTCFRKKIQLATSIWGMGFGTEFFIITPELAKKAFPLNFARFIGNYRFLKWAIKIGLFEGNFALQIIKVLKNPNKIYLIPGRRRVLPSNRFWSPNFYASHHDPVQRKKDISKKIRQTLGSRLNNMPNLNRFL